MNRPILFRAKALDSGEWLYGSLVSTDNSSAIVNITGKRIDAIEVDPETVQQRTANTHKGRELWEGDVFADPEKPEDLYEVIYDIIFDEFRLKMPKLIHGAQCSVSLRYYLINHDELQYTGNIVDMFPY